VHSVAGGIPNLGEVLVVKLLYRQTVLIANEQSDL
jgi:hypothetical protein